MSEQQRAAIQQARDWIAERPEDRTVSAGKMVAILTAALAAPQPPNAAEWKWAPTEPTEAMLNACHAVEPVTSFAPGTSLAQVDTHNNRLFYRAMLAAAPQPLEHCPENEPECSMNASPVSPELDAEIDAALGITKGPAA